MKKRRTPLQGLVKCRSKRTLLGKMLGSPEIESSLKAILYAQSHAIWRGLVATPPGSLLEKVVYQFKSRTAIPLELPFMAMLTLVAQYMAEQGAHIRLSEYQTIQLDLFSLVLAASGRCKSFSFKVIRNAMAAAGWSPRLLDEPGSSAAMFEELEEANGAPRYWRLDEWGEFWVSLQAEHHRLTKRYLLLAYDNDAITHRLKSKVQKNGVKQPNKSEVRSTCLSIYATSVLENIPKQLTAEDWKSGLVQRFGILVAQDDPGRPWYAEEYAFLDVINSAVISEACRKAFEIPVCKEYTLTPGARKVIARTFTLFGQGGGLGEDFVRRIEYRIFKYSAVFHWLLGKANALIDEEDVGWGARLASLHVQDLKYLMDSAEYQDYVDLFSRAMRLKAKLGREFTARNIRMYLRRHVSNMDEARAIHQLVTEYPSMPSKPE